MATQRLAVARELSQSVWETATVTQASQSKITYAYDPTNLTIDTETIQYDLDHDGTYEFARVLDRSKDTLTRDTGFQLKDGTTIENQANYGYSATDGRLSQISNPQISNLQFTYGYVPNSNLIQTVTGPTHTVTNTWETNRDVLDIKQNKVGTDVISKYDYSVNAIGQRSGVATSGNAFPAIPSWVWGYDSLGQVTSADSSINTSDRAYQYDTIGNRKKSADSLTLPSSDNYTSNALNQYSAIQQGSTGVSPAYDDDGNATAYPLPVAPSANSTLVWDGENRMISSTVGTTATTYLYDAQSRRIAKTTSGTSTLSVYDAWNCIAEYVGTTLSKTRLWGTDLSGTLQGAGGVGGLLSESQISNSQISNYYPTYDGNGNVSEYLASNGTVAAHFEYDPFGNTVVNTDMAGLFAYRFSTKSTDFETGLFYYGYRYYDPLTGRWPSRDPIEENGGINLYGFVENRPINLFDKLGLCSKCPEGSETRANQAGLNAQGRHGKKGCDAEYRNKSQGKKPDGGNGCGAKGSMWSFPGTGPGGANFERACNKHDDCYSTCGKTQAECDEKFMTDLFNECAAVNGGGKCEAMAGAYHKGVQWGGKKPHKDAQDAHCNWTPCCSK